MFRTNKLRGLKRFLDIRKSKTPKHAKINLTKSQILSIETSEIISLGEKIELLLLALGNKLTTELYMNVKYLKSNLKKPEEPNKKDIQQIEKLLEQLPFTYYKDSIPNKKNRQIGNLQNFTWFQVSLNKSVSKFMKDYPDDLTVFEEGVLYGFPLSAIRAFSGLIEPSHEKPTPASDYLAGVCSKDFWNDEQEYYQKWWDKLANLSPKLVKEAEDEFYQTHTTKK